MESRGVPITGQREAIGRKKQGQHVHLSAEGAVVWEGGPQPEEDRDLEQDEHTSLMLAPGSSIPGALAMILHPSPDPQLEK